MEGLIRYLIRYLESGLNISFIIYLILTALFIKLILERRTYPSMDTKKIVGMGVISCIMALIINFVFFLFFGLGYIVNGISLFFVLDIKLNYLNFISLSIVSFELIYDFYYLRTNIKVNNMVPYFILYGLIFLNSLIILKITFLANFLVLSLIMMGFIYYLLKVINEKNNIIRY